MKERNEGENKRRKERRKEVVCLIKAEGKKKEMKEIWEGGNGRKKG